MKVNFIHGRLNFDLHTLDEVHLYPWAIEFWPSCPWWRSFISMGNRILNFMPLLKVILILFLYNFELHCPLWVHLSHDFLKSWTSSLYNLGSTGSDSIARVPSTHSCTLSMDSPLTKRWIPSTPKENSFKASFCFLPIFRCFSRFKFSGSK